MRASVAMLIFNRPAQTQRVFQEIRRYQPPRLLVVADGPRSEAEALECAATRAVVEQVDWECEVLTNYSDTNLGCNHRVTSGLTWVFEQCEEAIILEDDCLPHPSFFHFCAELLERYHDDERVMMINGSNFQFGRKRTPYSYYFSRFPNIWGWASWHRAWHYHAIGLQPWPTLRKSRWLLDMLGDRDAAAHWRIMFDSAFAGLMTWDFEWTFTCWLQNSLAIAPAANLVSNIGFGEHATNATNASHRYANLPTREIAFPLHHPPYLVRDIEADRFEFRQGQPSDIYHRLRRRLGAAMPEPTRARLYNLLRQVEILK